MWACFFRTCPGMVNSSVKRNTMNWISVKQDCPPDQRDVLVKDEKLGTFSGAYYHGKKSGFIIDHPRVEEITHWMDFGDIGDIQAIPGYGEYNGECNRAACSNEGARWYNHSTKKHYCDDCARIINEFNPEAHDIYGHALCTEAPAPLETDERVERPRSMIDAMRGKNKEPAPAASPPPADAMTLEEFKEIIKPLGLLKGSHGDFMRSALIGNFMKWYPAVRRLENGDDEE